MPRSHEENFRSAVKTADYASARAALENGLAWFHTCPRTATEIGQVKLMLEWGIEHTRVRQAALADELRALNTVIGSYCPARPASGRHDVRG